MLRVSNIEHTQATPPTPNTRHFDGYVHFFTASYLIEWGMEKFPSLSQ